MAVRDGLPSHGVASVIISSVTLALAYVAVILRFYCRHLTGKTVALDDYLIIVSLVFTTSLIGLGIELVVNGGVGLHMWEATPHEIALSLKLFVAAPLLWGTATVFVKLSILAFYISIFTMQKLRLAVYFVVGLTMCQLVAGYLHSFLLCRPFAFTWDKTIPGGECGSTLKAWLAIAIVNLVNDMLVLILPMPALWSLKMPTRNKIVISAILGLGLIICGLTAARCWSCFYLNEEDFTYTVIPDVILGGLEVTLGIVNACLPILRPLFKDTFGPVSFISRLRSKHTNIENSHGSATWSKARQPASTKDFQRLEEDQYPLRDVVVSSTTDARHPAGHHNHTPQPGSIVVKKDIYQYYDGN